ncbi:hypothetical protein ACFJGV_13510 [Cnuibacter sp. UC19_7]|uniref:COG4705 family protein n=1 Tax=Cnuibacter sp. UC19_7 TaxID=3350166 RepID=UPI00366EDAFA
MTTITTTRRGQTLLSKVPEVTIWFWVIKILCTTVGESFADWINTALGVGLVMTAMIFTAVTVLVLTVQVSLRRYLPAPYWLTVVVLSITGTLYTDILTDQIGVPLWLSSSIFATALIIVFGIWYDREQTLSIHSITTRPREGFYWLAVLVTFALGTALGDWTLELTGWGPGASILLPAALIAITAALWRYGANPVLTFWIAYILTRPLGANIGDWLGLPSSEQGLGFGTFATSILFLAAIIATVIYLAVSRVDVTEQRRARAVPSERPQRHRASLIILSAVAAATIGLLAWTNSLPHASALADEGPVSSCDSGAQLTASDARAAASTSFPSTDLAEFRDTTNDIKTLVDAGDQKAAASRATDLETAWDDAQPRLQAANCQAWTSIDQKIDPVLSSVRASSPDPTKEDAALNDLLDTLPTP